MTKTSNDGVVAMSQLGQIRKLIDGTTIVRLVFSGTAAFWLIYQMA